MYSITFMLSSCLDLASRIYEKSWRNPNGNTIITLCKGIGIVQLKIKTNIYLKYLILYIE